MCVPVLYTAVVACVSSSRSAFGVCAERGFCDVDSAAASLSAVKFVQRETPARVCRGA